MPTIAMTPGPAPAGLSGGITEGMRPLTPTTPIIQGYTNGLLPGPAPGPGGGGITTFPTANPPALPDAVLLIGTWTRQRREAGGGRLQRQYWARTGYNVELRAVDGSGRVLAHAWGVFQLSHGVLTERFARATLTSRLEYIHKDYSPSIGWWNGRMILNEAGGRETYTNNWNG